MVHLHFKRNTQSYGEIQEEFVGGGSEQQLECWLLKSHVQTYSEDGAFNISSWCLCLDMSITGLKYFR